MVMQDNANESRQIEKTKKRHLSLILIHHTISIVFDQSISNFCTICEQTVRCTRLYFCKDYPAILLSEIGVLLSAYRNNIAV